MIEGTINSLNHLGRKKLGEKQREEIRTELSTMLIHRVITNKYQSYCIK
jgi:hypothetical protein